MQVVDAVYGARTRQFSETAEIQDLYSPASVEINVPFNVSYNAVNLSTSSLTMFGYITNTDTDTEIPGSAWTAEVGAGSSYSSLIPMTISADFNGTVTIGHVETALCSTIIDPNECVTAGCYWYDGACHSHEAGLPPWVIPAVIGVGVVAVVAIAVSGKPSRKRA